MTEHHWMTLLSSLALAVIVLGLIRWGWSSRKRRQADVAAPAEVPASIDGRTARFACDAQYVDTTTAGDWLDRIAVHGLGARANGQVLVFEEGAVVVRHGATDLWIPAEDILALRRESGMAGKFVEKNGLAVITWTLGRHRVDTGLRTREGAATAELLEALREIAPAAADGLPEPSECVEDAGRGARRI